MKTDLENSYILSFDIGGTKIAGGIFDSLGQEEKTRVIEQTSQSGYSEFLTIMDRIAEQLITKYPEIIKVGVGFCGTYDKKRDMVTSAFNAPYLEGKNLKKDIEELLKIRGIKSPLYVDNDANCAALVESIEGAGKGYNSVFLMIIGTGVGGGFVVDKKLLVGANGLSREIGSLQFPIYDTEDLEMVTRFVKQGSKDNAECYTGCYANIEQVIAGKGLKQLYEERTSKIAEAKEIGDLYNNKDSEAVKVMDEYFERVAKVVSVVVNMFDPEVIILSGGVSSIRGICDEVQSRMEKYTIIKNLNTKILLAEFGAMTGLRGAALLG